MLDDHDPNPATSCTADLSFAIASARAVVRALIAQDRDAAEEAALRTWRDCDLLVRLIRDLAAVLQTNDLNQLTCSQAELVWLARRAEYVLAFVGAPTRKDRSPCFPSAQGGSGRMPVFRQKDVAPPQIPNRVPPHPASSGLTVASTGLRVRLVPIHEEDVAASSHGDGASDEPVPDGKAHPKPVER
jgi:hypothetical protein